MTMTAGTGCATSEPEKALAEILDEANELTCMPTGVMQRKMNPKKLRNLLRTKFARISALAHAIHEQPESLMDRLDTFISAAPLNGSADYMARKLLIDARDELKKRGA